MKNFMIILSLLLIAATAIKADLLKCDDETILGSTLKEMPQLKDISIVGDKVEITKEDNSGEHKVRDFFKKIGCKIQSGYDKVSDGAAKIGAKIGEKAKTMGADIKTKFNDFKDKLSQDSDEDVTVPGHRLLRESVEIINPDILKAEQQCGHGHILDALGNCSKLRK